MRTVKYTLVMDGRPQNMTCLYILFYLFLHDKYIILVTHSNVQCILYPITKNIYFDNREINHNKALHTTLVPIKKK